MTAINRQYGANKYGQQKYGPSSIDQALGWGVEVDWNNDGLFDGSSESRRMRSFYSFRGRKNWLAAAGNGFESPQTGQCNIVLDNNNNLYDGWNTSSPLYPNVSSGRDVRVRIRDRATNAIYNVFRGVISKITPSGYDEDPTAQMDIEDGWRLLRKYPANIITQDNISPEAAIGLILDAINWPVRWSRNLTATGDLILYFWADGNVSAGQTIEDLQNSYFDAFFIDGAGVARLATRSGAGASVATFTQDLIGRNIANPQPDEFQRTVSKLNLHPRTVASLGVISQYSGTAISLGSGQSISVFLSYSYLGINCPANFVYPPIAGTDWGTNTAADGSGVDKTANAVMTFTDFGTTGKYTITNNDVGTVYVVPLQVRGKAIYETSSISLTYPEDTSGIENLSMFFMDMPWLQDVNVAHDLVNMMGNFLSLPHPFPVITVIDRPALQYGIELYDVVTLTIVKLGISGMNFRVGGIEHQSISDGCQSMQTTFYLEPFIANNYMVWDVSAVWDISTVFGY